MATVQLLRGAEVQFNELSSLLYRLSLNPNATNEELETALNLSAGGKLRSYLALLRKFKIIKNKGYELTKFGEILATYDIDFKSDITLWLLHYGLCSDKENVVLHELFGNIFYSFSTLNLNEVRDYFIKYNLPESTMKNNIRKEVRVSLKMYLEQNFSRLFLVDGEEIEKDVKYYSHKNNLDNEEIFYMLLIYYREFYADNSTSIPIREICYGDSSIGVICLLDEYKVRELLERLNAKKLISIESRADLDQIRFIEKETYIDIYKRIIGV